MQRGRQMSRERQEKNSGRGWSQDGWGGVMDHIGPCRYSEDFGFC